MEPAPPAPPLHQGRERGMAKHPRSQAGNIASPGGGSPGCRPSNARAPEPRESALSGSPGLRGDRRGGQAGATIRDSRTDSVPACRLRVGQSSKSRTWWPLAAARRWRPRGFWGRGGAEHGWAPAEAPQTPHAPQNLTHPMYHMDRTYPLHYRHPLPTHVRRAPQCTPESHAPHALQAFHVPGAFHASHAPHGAHAPRVPPRHLSTPSTSCTPRSPGTPPTPSPAMLGGFWQ